MAGKERVANTVLPYVDVDLVSYSAYDSTTQQPDTAELERRLTAALDYLAAQLPHGRHLPFEQRVFIGEFGFPLYNLWQYQDKAAEQDRRARALLRTAITWGAPFSLYWQMYDNEYHADLGGYSGFWLIDDQGTEQPLFHTLQDYFADLRAEPESVTPRRAVALLQ